ncbi:MAG: galactokinase [Phycisphaeraceae bacterium]|nr:galactokinase [Phycisphaeraceae bacterium]
MMSGPSIATLAARAADAFSTAFRSRPAFAAPGRVNLIGEHVDYNDGLVLPIAIDRWVVASVAPAANLALSRVRSTDLPGEATFDIRAPIPTPLLPPPPARSPPHWTAYAIGAAEAIRAEAATNGRPLPNLDVVLTSSIPIGAGLSSSAAIEAAVAGAFSAAGRADVDKRRFAMACRRAEHEFAGVPCGIMDQCAVVLARARHAMLLDCRDHATRFVPLPQGLAIVVMNSNTHRSLAGVDYAERRRACEAAAAALSLPSLRDADESMLAAAGERIPPDKRRLARHVVTEIDRVRQTADLLDRIAAGSLDAPAGLSAIGELFQRSHESLRDDFRVSCPELDTLVAIACSTPGVYGARMTGAGFGGCAIAIAEPAAVSRIQSAVAGQYPTIHGRDAEVFTVQPVRGASEIGG